jgi:Fe-S-cluster containining protein
LNQSQKNIIRLAHRSRKENKKFLSKLAANIPSGLDSKFHEAHQQVFQKTDCLTCANCCKTTSPIFRMVDIDRISSHLNIKSQELISRYLHLDEEGDYVLNSAPCVFLDADNYCKIYSVRPKACREYPHTDRKNMYQIMDLTYENTLVCPAVAEIVNSIKLLLNKTANK